MKQLVLTQLKGTCLAFKTCFTCVTQCVIPENIHTSPTDGSSDKTPPPHPLRISVPEGSCITPTPRDLLFSFSWPSFAALSDYFL